MSPWLADWVLDLPMLLFGAGLTALYLRGARGRQTPRPALTGAFVAGMTVLVLAHVSPVASHAEVLFWPHMIQHLLIVIVAAPLIAWSSPGATVRRALPPTSRHRLAAVARTTRRTRRRLGAPDPLVMATLAHIVAIWVWHTPVLYSAAVTDPALHLLEHASFAATAVWFFAEVRRSAHRTPRTQGLATLCLGAMIAQGAVLGALITFAGRPLYTSYIGTPGLSPLEDQQFAGALMWVPPGFVYGSLAVRRFLGWLAAFGSGDSQATVVRGRNGPAPAVGADRRDPTPTG